MGQGQERQALRIALALLLLALAGGRAAADPVFEPPAIGKVRGGGGEHDATLYGFIAEARLVGVLGGYRLSTWPDRGLGIDAGEPAAVAVRAGGVLWLTGAPFGFVLQADLAETLRPGVGGEKLWSSRPWAFVGALTDDLYVTWRPARALQLVVGRARVPITRQREMDERDLPLGGVPYLVDRVAPDRRWGAFVHGDFGAIAYAVGGWEDLDSLEPRGFDDASKGGKLLLGGQVEWTPVAPFYGSNPVGRVVGARGPLPTPRDDPWFATHRLSVGLGALVRVADAGGTRTDLSASVAWKWRWAAAQGEVFLSVPSGGAATLGGAWVEAHVTPVDRVSLSLRGEWDAEVGADGTATAGGGIMWHATRDRRSRIGFYGWLRARRETGVTVREDAAVVLVQTAI